MKLFIDANVVLDLILKRKPFFDLIAEILTLSENKNMHFACRLLQLSM